jgi:hypothetical protein
MTFLFDVDEEADDSRFSGTIPQALLLLNGRLTNAGSSAIPGAALPTVLAMPGDDKDKIEALYLRALARLPTQPEIERWIAFVNAPNDLAAPPTAPSPDKKGDKPDKKGEKKAPKKGGGGPGGAERALDRLTPKGATPKQQAYEDLFWALINSSEFYFNH